MQASVVLQRVPRAPPCSRDRVFQVSTGGRGIGESDEDDDEDDNGTSIARSAEDQAVMERAAKATS